MKHGKPPNMITFTCDLCKDPILKHQDSKLTLRSVQEMRQWDLCAQCVFKLASMFGEGRKLGKNK